MRKTAPGKTVDLHHLNFKAGRSVEYQDELLLWQRIGTEIFSMLELLRGDSGNQLMMV